MNLQVASTRMEVCLHHRTEPSGLRLGSRDSQCCTKHRGPLETERKTKAPADDNFLPFLSNVAIAFTLTSMYLFFVFLQNYTA